METARVQVEYHFPVEGRGAVVSYPHPECHAGDVLLSGQYQAWLPITGFVSPTVEFLPALLDYTVTSPASAVGVICCGAYDSAGKSLYAKSSRGPAWDGRILQDLAAPGVGVRG